MRRSAIAGRFPVANDPQPQFSHLVRKDSQHMFWSLWNDEGCMFLWWWSSLTQDLGDLWVQFDILSILYVRFINSSATHLPRPSRFRGGLDASIGVFAVATVPPSPVGEIIVRLDYHRTPKIAIRLRKIIVSSLRCPRSSRRWITCIKNCSSTAMMKNNVSVQV